MSTPSCIVCDTSFAASPEWEKGEIIECTACGQEHEVIDAAAEPARIDLAPEVEEDWGE
jgi:alpha-aminoadipate/glutamate carrier protein LysW